MRQIGPRGVYGDPVLPDFMVFLNWKSLPWFWHGFNHFPFALAMMVLAPALLALVFGWFAFRSRVTGVYFSIITQALTYALMLAFFRNDMGFGGNNGFTDFKDVLGFDLHSDRTRVALLVVTAAALAASYMACRAIVESRAGRVVRAIRDGHVSVTSGPILDAEIQGAGPGATLHSAAHRLPLHVRVRAAPWIDVTEVEVLLGPQGRRVRWLPVKKSTAIVRLDTEIELATGGGKTFVVVVAKGERELPNVFLPKVRPYAFTNPIWIEP
jgi:hypothetical protein